VRKTITFRLRTIDDDLQNAIETMDSSTLSDLCRDGLRYMLGINTTKRMEMQEKPLTRQVEEKAKRTTESILTTQPKLFSPNNRNNTKRDQS
jgi:hypothetical protein